MPTFTTEQIRALMDQPDMIRSLSVIAHVDHGKSTLTDSLVKKAGISNKSRFTDGSEEERKRGITIKSTGVTMAFRYDVSKKAELFPVEGGEAEGEREAEGEGGGAPYFLINLIDSPGHVDFSSEVTAALRITDGALVVVDCIEGVCVQTETVLRQAMAEKVVPVLMLNKVDRAFLELHMNAEDAYQNFRKSVESVNVIIAPYEAEEEDVPAAANKIGPLQVNPVHGTVAFGSGKQNWGFTLGHFAKMYAAKFGMSVADFQSKLWGDHFLDVEHKVWKSGSPDKHLAAGLRRAFVQFCLDPVQQLFEAVMSEKTKKVEKMLATIGVTLRAEEKASLKGSELVQVIMSRWLPCAEALLEMIVMHLPSPARAQRYRAEVLYDGPLDDTAAQAIMACDKNGPLMMYVSKMIPHPTQKGMFYAFGRVFSGTISSGKPVRIMGPNYEPGPSSSQQQQQPRDLWVKPIQQTAIMMGSKAEPIRDVPCGNNVALLGVDSVLIKTGTISSIPDAHGFKSLKMSVAAVVRVAVNVVNAIDLPKLVEGLRNLAKTDPLIECTSEESGEHIVAGAGELHLEICLKDLADNYMKGAPIVVSQPIVSYRETCTAQSSRTCLAKSQNNHNRLFCNARAFPDMGLAERIDAGDIGPRDDAKARARILADEYGMEVGEARKLWSFGPEGTGANLFFDATKGVQWLEEIRDGVDAGFQWATREGPLSEEPMRGVICRLLDATLHADAIHRGAGQIMPAARRACYSSLLTASPTFMEPVYAVDVTTHVGESSVVYNVISQRRGMVLGENQLPGSSSVVLKCHLPVAQSFGLAASLREASGGKASAQCSFSHWAVMNLGDPTVPGTKANELAVKIRVRKGLDAAKRKEVPLLNEWLDEL